MAMSGALVKVFVRVLVGVFVRMFVEMSGIAIGTMDDREETVGDLEGDIEDVGEAPRPLGLGDIGITAAIAIEDNDEDES
jgi:hypothetical protein